VKDIIHIHIPKTGGTWLTKTLEEYTPESYLRTPNWHPLRLSSEIHNQWRDSVWSNPTAQAYFDNKLHRLHMQTFETPETRDVFHNALKVTIVRNPFDYLVSCYHYQPQDAASLSMQKYVPGGGPTGYGNVNAVHGISSFEDYILKFCDPDFQWTQEVSETRYNLFYHIFLSNGYCGVDVIFKNERLSEGVDQFLKAEGYVGRDINIANRPKIGIGKARKQKDYRSFYTDELRELIEGKCYAELTLFEYDFDGTTNDNLTVNPQSLFYHPIPPVSMKHAPDRIKSKLAHEWEYATIRNEGGGDLSKKTCGSQHIWGTVWIVDENEKAMGTIGATRYEQIAGKIRHGN